MKTAKLEIIIEEPEIECNIEILAQEVHRFGLVKHNKSFYMNKNEYANWYTNAMAQLQNIDTRDRLECYREVREMLNKPTIYKNRIKN